MRLSTAKLKHLNEIQNISSSLLGNFVAYTEDFQILLFLGGYIRERERDREDGMSYFLLICKNNKSIFIAIHLKTFLLANI